MDRRKKVKLFVYLDELRESGATNMFGAAPFLECEFPDISPAEAEAALQQWMRSDRSLKPEQRVALIEEIDQAMEMSSGMVSVTQEQFFARIRGPEDIMPRSMRQYSIWETRYRVVMGISYPGYMGGISKSYFLTKAAFGALNHATVAKVD